MNTPDLFSETKPPRPAPRKLMHVCDAADDEDPAYSSVRFHCARCGHESDWIDGLTVTEAKRGMPCPACNPSDVMPS